MQYGLRTFFWAFDVLDYSILLTFVNMVDDDYYFWEMYLAALSWKRGIKEK